MGMTVRGIFFFHSIFLKFHFQAFKKKQPRKKTLHVTWFLLELVISSNIKFSCWIFEQHFLFFFSFFLTWSIYYNLHSWGNLPKPPAGAQAEPLSRGLLLRKYIVDVPEVVRVTLTREEKESPGMVVLKSWQPLSTCLICGLFILLYTLIYAYRCVEVKLRWRPGLVGFFWTEDLASFLPGQPKGSQDDPLAANNLAILFYYYSFIYLFIYLFAEIDFGCWFLFLLMLLSLYRLCSVCLQMSADCLLFLWIKSDLTVILPLQIEAILVRSSDCIYFSYYFLQS